jgi:hypothetical protein
VTEIQLNLKRRWTFFFWKSIPRIFIATNSTW